MEHSEFAQAYRLWYRPMLLYAYALTGEESRAEDLVQTAFMKALLSYTGEVGSLRFWLMRVLRNEFISNYRKDTHLTDAAALERLGGGDPLEQMLKREEQRRVYEAVLALPEKYREVLLQGVVMGLSDGEIARLWDTTEENVRKLRQRAREKVKKKLEEGEA